MYQIFLATNMIEGLENQYQSYDTNNPDNTLILAQKNAGNIAYLKERIDSMEGSNINKEIQDLSGNVQTLQTQVNSLVQAQSQYANQMTGGSPPQITGTGATTNDNDVTEDNSKSNLITS
jgi:hypothetical protein